MALYASGGWADVDGIGAELGAYVAAGFGAVKMRVGVMDGDRRHQRGAGRRRPRRARRRTSG